MAEVPFKGLTLRAHEAGDACVSENAYAARSRLSRHTHPAAFFSLTLAGGYMERHGARAVEYAKGSIGFHPAGEEHAVEVGTANVRCLNVTVPTAWMQPADGALRPTAFVRAAGGPLAWRAESLLAEAREWTPSSTSAVEEAVLEMLSLAARSQGPGSDRMPPRWLDEAEEILRAEHARPLRVHALAARVGVHPVHLARTWRRFRCSSLVDAVRRLRVAEARRRLATDRESLADIALGVGFADQPHFTREFRRVTGTTPGAYRRGARRA